MIVMERSRIQFSSYQGVTKSKMDQKKKNDIEKVTGFSGLKKYLEEVYEKPVSEIELPDIEEMKSNVDKEDRIERFADELDYIDRL